jgi:hypothetical protein
VEALVSGDVHNYPPDELIYFDATVVVTDLRTGCSVRFSGAKYDCCVGGLSGEAYLKLNNWYHFSELTIRYFISVEFRRGAGGAVDAVLAGMQMEPMWETRYREGKERGVSSVEEIVLALRVLFL